MLEIEKVLNAVPEDWLKLTTHRLDIYNEDKAKTEFLSEFVKTLSDASSLDFKDLPTAYDYIRLGHQLSCLAEYYLGKHLALPAERVITFCSKTMSLLAFFRYARQNKKNVIVYYEKDDAKVLDILSIAGFDEESFSKNYCYNVKFRSTEEMGYGKQPDDFLIRLNSLDLKRSLEAISDFDAAVYLLEGTGSVACVYADSDPAEKLASEIQHVRRRESVALTPADSYALLSKMVGKKIPYLPASENDAQCINKAAAGHSGGSARVLIGSSGLSVQYAIFMGFVDKIKTEHPNSPIKFIVPTNCYGGTNDGARRIAAIDPLIDIIDLKVDSDDGFIEGLDTILKSLASENAASIVLAEIPSNPRVKVPDMGLLSDVLREGWERSQGKLLFTLDQTFCPDFPFLEKGGAFEGVATISYVSCSKFPSGGLCTGGYVTGNGLSASALDFAEKHLKICDNQATGLQLKTIAQNITSMPERIKRAFQNTKDFTDHMQVVCPGAKINFVSEKVSSLGFRPSVCSIELPAKGDSIEQREKNQRKLNLDLINFMITKNPEQCKHCVSYGQLKGSYWTVPATSTQGTTRESDKDYIVRIAMSPNVDLNALKASFTEFCKSSQILES